MAESATPPHVTELLLPQHLTRTETQLWWWGQGREGSQIFAKSSSSEGEFLAASLEIQIQRSNPQIQICDPNPDLGAVRKLLLSSTQAYKCPNLCSRNCGKQRHKGGQISSPHSEELGSLSSQLQQLRDVSRRLSVPEHQQGMAAGRIKGINVVQELLPGDLPCWRNLGCSAGGPSRDPCPR